MQRCCLRLENLTLKHFFPASNGFYGCTQTMSGTFLGATGSSGEKIMHKVACIESCRAVDDAFYAIHNKVKWCLIPVFRVVFDLILIHVTCHSHIISIFLYLGHQ